MAIVAFIAGWLAGVGAAAQVSVSTRGWAVAGLLFVAFAVLGRRTRFFIVFVLLGGGALGAARFQMSQVTPGPKHVISYNDSGHVAVYGQIQGPPRVSDRAVDAVMEVSALATSTLPPSASHGFVQLRAPRFVSLHYGDWITATGRLQTPRSTDEFDYRAYLARREIYSEMLYPVVEQASGPPPNPVRVALYQFRDRAARTINTLLPEPQAALLRGILLGDDDGLPPDLQEAFRISGTAHIIAISGFNIAILAGILLRLVLPFAGPRWAVWPALGLVALYTILVGAEASVVRAAVMAGLYLFTGRWLGRTLLQYAALLLAAFVMTVVRPAVLWEAGFQLSFAATFGLLVYAEPLSRGSRALLARWTTEERADLINRLLSEGVIVTLAAQLVTLPLLLYHFQQLVLFSPLANVFILPAQPGVMIWGGLATLAGMVWQPLGQLLALPAWLFLTYTIAVAEWFAGLPSAAIRITLSPAGVVTCYVIIALVTWIARHSPRLALAKVQEQAPRLALTGVVALGLVAWQWTQTRPDGRLHVSFLDVGQGDATLIRTPSGRRVLIDGGHFPSVLQGHLGRLLPYGDRRIDLVIASHPDADHVAGLPVLVGRYEVAQLLTNGAAAEGDSAYATLLQTAAEKQIPVLQAEAGQVIHLGDGVQIHVLFTGSRSSGDNDSSLGLRLTYGAFSVLLTGDAEVAAEQAMVASGVQLSSLVFKAGHHGARTSSNDFFLDAVQPQVIVVSTGAENTAGHPHTEMLQRASAAGSVVLRTDELGTIEVVSDGTELWWGAMR
ncbi:MAG: DNA internalization-related competence protein ComEC/Rec2 [Anaerolineae bacterium]|nr:DNA internalization-related competence protein ComEC/Rec2 [Anaerolineae bacterium]